MAITKIHPINKTLNNAISYITDDKKTDEKIYTSSVNCSVETAFEEMRLTQKESNSKAKILARHLIQSFAIGEVSPEMAHEIGKKLVDEHLKDNYEVVISTHIDKGHIHNHIIWNNISFKTNKGYVSNKKTYHQIRKISDKLCKEYSLSIIDDFYRKRQGKVKNSYKGWKEYNEFKKGNSWKEKVKLDIDDSIENSKDFYEFISDMKSKKYQVKFGKHIAFKPEGKDRFIRSKTIGEDYTEDNIKFRISQKFKKNFNEQAEYQHDYRFIKLVDEYKKTNLDFNIVDLNLEKFKENKGLRNWALKNNFEALTKTRDYLKNLNIDENNIDSSLEKILIEKEKYINLFIEKDLEIKKYIKILQNFNIYTKYKIINEEFEKTDDLNFKEEYSLNNQLFLRSKRKLEQFFKDKNIDEIKEIDLVQKIENLERNLRTYNTKIDDLNQEYANLNHLKNNLSIYFNSNLSIDDLIKNTKDNKMKEKLIKYKKEKEKTNIFSKFKDKFNEFLNEKIDNKKNR